jgi:hypothetical protein
MPASYTQRWTLVLYHTSTTAVYRYLLVTVPYYSVACSLQR